VEIVVIGGGIGGLAAALSLQALDSTKFVSSRPLNGSNRSESASMFCLTPSVN